METIGTTKLSGFLGINDLVNTSGSIFSSSRSFLILSILITRPIRILYNIMFSTIFKRSSNGVEQFGNDTFDFLCFVLSPVNQRCVDCWGMFCVHKDPDKLLPIFTANNWSRLRAQVAFYRGLTSLTLLCSTQGGILRGRLINITFDLTASSVFLFWECNQLISSRMSFEIDWLLKLHIYQGIAQIKVVCWSFYFQNTLQKVALSGSLRIHGDD